MVRDDQSPGDTHSTELPLRLEDEWFADSEKLLQNQGTNDVHVNY